MTTSNSDANEDRTNTGSESGSDTLQDSQAQRKVAPTLLEASYAQKKAKTRLTNLFSNFKRTIDQPRTKIARTLLEDSVRGQERVSHEAAAAAKKKRPSQIFVAKTMLDYETIQHALSGAIEKTAAAAAEKPEREPGIQDVKGFKAATACPSKAVCKSLQRIDYCGTCGIEMYNLEGMDAEQGRGLIFTRENRDNFQLFKRHDGLFMTRDCPMVAKNAKKRIMLLVALAFAVIGSVVLVSLIPPPPKNSPVTTATSVDESSTSSATEKTEEAQKSEVLTPVPSSAPVPAAKDTKTQEHYYYELPAAAPDTSTSAPLPQNEVHNESSSSASPSEQQQPVGY